ncbi:MAG: hypothetical protein H6873_11770 [Hyphomicrobiaceae bacterium]|nr:hypothetical protein [Hyphomicrobiaceae bacterium]
MRGIAFYFFVAAVICVTIGMAWGIIMAATNDHLLAPAHAHLNLVGWVTMALFGLYYHVTPKAAASGLPRIHFGLAILGVVTMVPGIAIVIVTENPILAIIGSLLTISSMLVFLYTVWTNGLGSEG